MPVYFVSHEPLPSFPEECFNLEETVMPHIPTLPMLNAQCPYGDTGLKVLETSGGRVELEDIDNQGWALGGVLSSVLSYLSLIPVYVR